MNISVIIPSYKPQSYLWECLQSLKSQTIQPNCFEVIIVLNGCCEPYYSSIQNYLAEEKMSNVRLIQTDTGGVSNARNIGIDNAKGEYIAFIDDDDYVSASYLEELYETAQHNDVTPVSNVIAFDDATGAKLPNYLTNCFRKIEGKGEVSLLAAKSFMSVPVAKLFRLQDFGETRFNPRFAVGEDSLFVFQVSRNMKHIKATSSNAIYYRRVRQASASMKRRNRWIKVNNSLRLIWEFTRVYLSDVRHYNFWLYLSRVAARLRHIANDTFSSQ